MDPKLYEGARSGDIALLDSIRDNTALLSQLTPKKNTILHISAEFKQLRFFQKATSICPSSLFNEVNSKGESPLHVASRVGCSDIVAFIIHHSKLLYADIEDGQIGGHMELLRMVNVDGDTTLHCAARGGHLDVAKQLIEADSQLSASVNNAEESPICIAAAKEFCDIVDLILTTSPSSYGGRKGMTALHAALYYQLNDTMKKLVKKRPELIRKGDDIGWTPIHYAAHFGNVNALKLFLKKERESSSSVAYLLGKDGESALQIAAFRGRIDVMKELIRSRPDCFELVDKKGRSALHAAVLGGEESSVRYILGIPQLGGLVNEGDEDGNTPLHLAALHRKYSIIAILARDSRVDIRSTNKMNLTALGIYSKFEESGFAAAKVFFMLKETYGIEDVQSWVSSHVQKMVMTKEPPQEETTTIHSTTTDTRAMHIPPSSPHSLFHSSHQKKPYSTPEKGNMLEIHLLVAVLIATVTFAAAFTLPGGYMQNGDGPNKGMAVLSSRVAFKMFVVFDTLAFCCAVAAVYLQFGTSGGGYHERARFVNVTMILIFIAILAMVLAFASGMYVVLAKSIGIGLTAFITAGCFVLTFCLRWFVDPLGNPDLGMRPLRKYVRNTLFKYGII